MKAMFKIFNEIRLQNPTLNFGDVDFVKWKDVEMRGLVWGEGLKVPEGMKVEKITERCNVLVIEGNVEQYNMLIWREI